MTTTNSININSHGIVVKEKNYTESLSVPRPALAAVATYSVSGVQVRPSGQVLRLTLRPGLSVRRDVSASLKRSMQENREIWEKLAKY